MAKTSWARPLPVGECWCGCGETTDARSFFLPGHDKRAESMVILAEYGSVVDFLAAHGYGPGGKRTIDAKPKGGR